MMRPPLMPIIVNAILRFLMILLVMLSGLCMSASVFVALILAESACVFQRIHCLYFEGGRKDIKRAIRISLPGIVVIAIVSLVGTYVKDSLVQDIVKYVSGIATVVLIFPIVVPVYYEDRHNVILSSRIISPLQKTFNVLFKLPSRILIILGFLLVFFAKPYTGFYFECLVIVGCVLWYAREILETYCWRNCPIKNAVEVPETSAYENDYSESDGERAFNEREIKLLVKKIADRWSYKEYPLYLAEGKVRLNVTVDVTCYGIAVISFTINAKLSGVKAGDLDSARLACDNKMDKAAFEIKEETKMELSKHAMQYSSYEINVHKGYIS